MPRSKITPLRDDSAAIDPLPHNMEAEQALLGAVLLDNSQYAKIAGFLSEEHFYVAAHGRIYSAIAQFLDQGQTANPVTLKVIFDQDSALISQGGAAYLMRLAENVITLINTEFYARHLVDLYQRRVLVGLGETVVDRARRESLDDPVAGQIEEAADRLYEISEASGESRARPAVPIGQLGHEAIADSERAFRDPRGHIGIGSGIEALDRVIGGFLPGYYILGGRPGQGKTALAGSIAYAAAANEHPVLFFSGEMPAQQITRRLLAAISGISAARQRRGELIPEDFQSLVNAQVILQRLPIHVDDSPLTLPRIRQQSRMLQRRLGIELVIIDYLQLMALGARAESESRGTDVGRVSNRLKLLANDLRLPVLALAALSRGVEGRDDKRPMLADLRYTGEIEQDADVVMFVYRHETYLARAEPRQTPHEGDQKFQERHAMWSNALAGSRGKAEIIVAKNRHGRDDGVVRVAFNAECSLFHDPDNSQGKFW